MGNFGLVGGGFPAFEADENLVGLEDADDCGFVPFFGEEVGLEHLDGCNLDLFFVYSHEDRVRFNTVDNPGFDGSPGRMCFFVCRESVLTISDFEAAFGFYEYNGIHEIIIPVFRHAVYARW